MILLSPGPVPVLPEILQAQTREMITHRSEGFGELYQDLVERLKGYLSAHEAYVVTGSGALGVETLLLNLCKKEEKMLCLSNGDFGSRFAEIAKVYTQVQEERVAAGKGWNLERAKEYIDNSKAQALGMVYNETGYGVCNDVRDICQYAKEKGMRIILDAISAWPAHTLNMKEFGVDGFVTGSQKAIGAPPGMTLLALSEEASEYIAKRDNIPNIYCDLRRHRKFYEEKNHQTPNTPAISLFYALQRAFDVLDRQGGVEASAKNHFKAANYVRGRLIHMGFKLIAEEGFRSNTVTAFLAQKPKEIRQKLLEEHEIKIVGCKGDFKTNGLRIAHMGNFDLKNIDKCMSALEKIKESL